MAVGNTFSVQQLLQTPPVVKELNTNGLILVIPVFHIRGVGHTGGFTIICTTVQLTEMSLLCSRSVKVEGQAVAHCLATCTAFSGGANIFIHEYMPFKLFSVVAKGPKLAPFSGYTCKTFQSNCHDFMKTGITIYN